MTADDRNTPSDGTTGDATANVASLASTDDVGRVGWVSARTSAMGFRTVVRAGQHVFVADEPASVGGTEEGATPYDYLLGAVAACTAMTLRMYAHRKGWPLEEAIVDVRTGNSHASDCAACVERNADAGPGVLERRIELRGPLSEEQRERLLVIADRCPVKQALQRGITLVSDA